MIVEPNYRGFRIEVNAIAEDSALDGLLKVDHPDPLCSLIVESIVGVEVSAASEAPVEVVAGVEAAATVLARAERARSCGAPRPQSSAATLGPSFDHLIRPQQQRRRDGQAKRFGGFEIDRQLELRCSTGRSPGVAPLKILST